MSVFPHILCNPEGSQPSSDVLCSKLTDKKWSFPPPPPHPVRKKLASNVFTVKIHHFNDRVSEVGIRMIKL